jgi:hypothetical protein
MSTIEKLYDLEFKVIEKKINKICNLNTYLKDEPEIREIIKVWAKDVAVLKADIQAEQKAKEHFRQNEVNALLDLNSIIEQRNEKIVLVRCINPKNTGLKTDKIYEATESEYIKECYIIDVGWNLVVRKDMFEVMDSTHEA